MTTALTRRVVLAGSCAAGCAALAGCATYSAGSAPAPATTAAPAPAPSSAAQTAPGTGAPAAPAPTLTTDKVPVGGGTILADKGIVVTQPTAGTFKAFSSTCTHQGCQVNGVADGKITCPCHGSEFSITDGAPTAGPAKRPLPAKTVTVSGTGITVA